MKFEQERQGFSRLGKYKNKLGLKGIPRIKEIIPNDIGFFFGIFYDANDELRYFADILKEWNQQRKCLADYIQNEEHREAVLGDLYKLRDWMAIGLQNAMIEQGQPLSSESVYYVERRSYFVKETFPYEEGRLLSWEAPIERESPFDFQSLKGRCFITYQNGAVTKLRLELQEAGFISIGWKQSGDAGKEKKIFEQQVAIDSRRVALLVVAVTPPARSGVFYIYNQTRNTADRVPVF